MLPTTLPAFADAPPDGAWAMLAQLVEDHRRLSELTATLDPSSRVGLQQLVQAIGTRLERLRERARGAANGTAAGPRAAPLQEIEAVRSELAIVQATLRGRVSSPPPPLSPAPATRAPQETQAAQATQATEETRQMARKPWLFDPENISELESLAIEDDLEPDSDDSWDEWQDWTDGESDDDEPAAHLRGPRAHEGDWGGHDPRARGRRRSPSHRQL